MNESSPGDGSRDTLSPGARAVRDFEIDDVFLVESDCKVARDHNPTVLITEFAYSHQVGADQEVMVQIRVPASGGDAYTVLRYRVRAQVRLLKPGIPTNKPDIGDDDFQATMNILLAVDYRVPSDAAKDLEAVGAFSKNAVFHAWPYLREEIHSACSRLRIPRVTIPMFRSGVGPNVVLEPAEPPGSD